MRKYQPIWERLKTEGTAELAADCSLHDRIIEAVKKEKKKDLGWKFLLEEEGKKKRLKIRVEGTLLTFKLVATHFIKLSDL